MALTCCAGRWEARIGVPGSKHIYLGLYESEDEAARVCLLDSRTAHTCIPYSQSCPSIPSSIASGIVSPENWAVRLPAPGVGGDKYCVICWT